MPQGLYGNQCARVSTPLCSLELSPWWASEKRNCCACCSFSMAVIRLGVTPLVAAIAMNGSLVPSSLSWITVQSPTCTYSASPKKKLKIRGCAASNDQAAKWGCSCSVPALPACAARAAGAAHGRAAHELAKGVRHVRSTVLLNARRMHRALQIELAFQESLNALRSPRPAQLERVARAILSTQAVARQRCPGDLFPKRCSSCPPIRATRWC